MAEPLRWVIRHTILFWESIKPSVKSLVKLTNDSTIVDYDWLCWLVNDYSKHWAEENYNVRNIEVPTGWVTLVTREVSMEIFTNSILSKTFVCNWETDDQKIAYASGSIDLK